MDESIIELDNGTCLYNSYGKYKSNLCFLGSRESLEKFISGELWRDVPAIEFNLPRGDYSIIAGEYFVSKKGTKCFRIKEDGKHILIRDNWGGCFNDYRGGNLEKLPNKSYYRRASSNGGGTGNDFCIVPTGTKYQLSEDDI